MVTDDWKVRSTFRRYCHKSSDRSARLLFLRWAAAWFSLRPTLSRPIALPSHRLTRGPAVRRAARLRVESRCSERQWTAQCGGAFLESYKFLSLSPSCVKVQLRPLWLHSSLMPQPPSTGPHSGSLSCSSFRASTLCKEERLLSHNSPMARSALSSSATQQGVRVQCATHSYTLVLGFPRLWTYGPAYKKKRQRLTRSSKVFTKLICGLTLLSL